MSLPYYLMYPKDFDTSEKVKVMGLLEKGLYLECLNQSWINNGLPSDPEDIRLCLRVSEEEFGRAWKRVEACFPIGDDGRRRNSRQEEEREKALVKTSRTQKANESRLRGRLRDDNVDVIKEERVIRASDSVSVSVFKEYSKKEEPAKVLKFENAPPGYAMDELYFAFRQVWFDNGASVNEESFMGFCWFEWKRLDGEQKVAALKGICEWADPKSPKARDPALWNNPRAFLEGRMWTLPPRPKPKQREINVMEGV